MDWPGILTVDDDGDLRQEARSSFGRAKGGGGPRVVHLSADFPDPIEPGKTPVIRTLLDLTGERFDHRVISLNRRPPGILRFGRELLALGAPDPQLRAAGFAYGCAVTYEAPPFGLFLATMLRRLADELVAQVRELRPSLLVAHKLTIEGIVARRLSARLGVPFALCLQGDTDTKILGARPDLAPEYRQVFHQAAMVFPFTPWALGRCQARLGRRSGPVMLLPCPTELDRPVQPVIPGDGLLSVFHLKNHRRKNLRGMAAAMERVRQGRAAPLSIVGGGSDDDLRRCRTVAGKSSGIVFEGPLSRDELGQRMSRATGFVLPSRRESFGLVFIEALFCGLPVIYPRGMAIDGYFDGAPFAIPVDARDPAAIAQAMRRLLDDERPLKQALKEWQDSEDAKRFMRKAIGDTFAKGLSCALNV